MSSEGAYSSSASVEAALAALDALPVAELEAEIGHCCGSRRFVQDLLAQRPFGSRESLLAATTAAEAQLERADWLEAFAHHPRIGDIEALRVRFASAQSKAWSQNEQEGVAAAEEATLEALAAGNAAYEARFGYLFIVCATGKSAAEMLAILEQRLGNEAAAELPIAAQEQSKITRLRLDKLLAKLAGKLPSETIP